MAFPAWGGDGARLEPRQTQRLLSRPVTRARAPPSSRYASSRTALEVESSTTSGGVRVCEGRRAGGVGGVFGRRDAVGPGSGPRNGENFALEFHQVKSARLKRSDVFSTSELLTSLLLKSYFERQAVARSRPALVEGGAWPVRRAAEVDLALAPRPRGSFREPSRNRRKQVTAPLPAQLRFLTPYRERALQGTAQQAVGRR
ncbi:hypothetical protein SKAU_G00315080 [Synaphobranchus kaupii]|uniref:Uncharacterized protein n=1 Tax=Synaphobranchus kaupii TaxID=118154 RepID=A0A9Q1ESI2_SYNKA|nr:hypothetical protein SKAU_G00315080 [Synaphobranchus kaupii]